MKKDTFLASEANWARLQVSKPGKLGRRLSSSYKGAVAVAHPATMQREGDSIKCLAWLV